MKGPWTNHNIKIFLAKREAGETPEADASSPGERDSNLPGNHQLIQASGKRLYRDSLFASSSGFRRPRKVKLHFAWLPNEAGKPGNEANSLLHIC